MLRRTSGKSVGGARGYNTQNHAFIVQVCKLSFTLGAFHQITQPSGKPIHEYLGIGKDKAIWDVSGESITMGVGRSPHR